MSDGYAIDALTDRSPGGILWTRVNSAESLPGVITPVTWSFYGRTLEPNVRLGFADLGIIPRSETRYPAQPGDRILGIFHGRVAVNVNVLRRVMSGLPGVSGDDVERDLLGSVRPGVVNDGIRNRLPAVLAKTPIRLMTAARDTRLLCAETHQWWARRVGPQGPREPQLAAELLEEALARFGTAVRLQGRTRMLFQASSAQLAALAELVGEPETASTLMAGSAGTEEARVADDLWATAMDRLPLTDFIAKHGFHGPNSSELSSRSWREDPAPIERLLATIRDSEPPAERRARATAERERVLGRILAGLTPIARARARLLLRLAPATTRSLEHTKSCFLIASDVGRAAVRALGEQLVMTDQLDDSQDAFHLFAEELLSPGRRDLRAVIEERRDVRARCLAIELPETWEGQPNPATKHTAETREPVTTIVGVGASPGVAEGRVRVIHDASDDVDLDPGAVLVCPTTDPSWLAMMSVASALVIDIGAAASHGAIVARELGVPCVIGTRTGTIDLDNGDYVRVDGSRGLVERLPALSASPATGRTG